MGKGFPISRHPHELTLKVEATLGNPRVALLAR